MRTLVTVLVVSVVAGGCAQSATSPSASASASQAPSETTDASPTPEPTSALLPSTTEPADEAPQGAVVIHVGPGPKFSPERVRVQAGEELAFFLDATEINEGSAHNFKIGPDLPPEAPLAESDFIQRGESVVFTVTGLEPGTYRFWCSVEEHHRFGMHGTLVVES
ncbi:MAG TPA: cupredoxin domain-containing protein [Candidatus Limnocylindria bacterium]|nr:cupredoxin domain-containing protein [Candidatus Limnocylindria bacterium]